MKKPITVWIALSAAGHPAPFLGWAYRRKDLVLTTGYRAVRATLLVA